MTEPLLLIHGFTDTAATWTNVIPLVEPYHEVLAPTLSGHCGGPEIPVSASDPIAAMADELERTLDAAGHEQAHLAGNSLGGWLAFELAARGRAQTVVALSPALGWENDDPPKRSRRVFENARRFGPFAARHAEFLARRPGLRKLAFRDLVAHPERMSPAVAYDLINGSAGCTAYDSFIAHLDAKNYRSPWKKSFGIPVRIAWGTDDRTLPVDLCSTWHRQTLPDAEWIDLPGCGHLPQHDDPELVARTILEVTARAAVAA